MKKKAAVLAMAAALLFTAACPALAAAGEPYMTRYKQRMDAKKLYVDEAVKNGRLTEEQGKKWKDHFDYMIKFHEENGFLCPGGPGKGKGFGGKMNGPGNAPGR